MPLTRNNLDSLPQKQPIPATTQIPQKQQAPQISMAALLKEPLESFLEKEPEYQRNMLGTILYPMVLKKVGEEYAPKITGMLIDFDNFGVPIRCISVKYCKDSPHLQLDPLESRSFEALN